MEEYIGQIGIIQKVNKWGNFTVQLNVLFEDGRRFNFYVDEDNIDLYLIESDASEIEQLKADKEELADLLKKHIKHRQGAYNFMSGYERELHDISKQTLEKHGK